MQDIKQLARMNLSLLTSKALATFFTPSSNKKKISLPAE
jgi:hypothetical protein